MVLTKESNAPIKNDSQTEIENSNTFQTLGYTN